MFHVICVSTRSFYFASGGQGKNRGSHSETLASYIKTTYLLEQRTVEYLSVKKPILGARMSATVSACLSLEKYFCSFSNKISCIISESIPVPRFEDEEKRCFWRGKTICLLFKTLRSLETRWKEIWPILSAALQLHYVRSINIKTELKTVDYGLRTADCGLWTTDSAPHLREKNSSAHIVIFQRFLKFAIAKIEMSNSSSLPLTPPCCEAWPLRLENREESPLKVTGMFGAFLRERNFTFWVFNIFNHRGTAYGCA